MFRTTIIRVFLPLVAISAMGLTSQAKAGCWYTYHTTYSANDWSFTPSYASDLAGAQADAQWWIRNGSQGARVYNACTRQWFAAAGGGGGGTREVWYRVTYMERYPLRDQYGRWYWSNWQGAGGIENPNYALVSNNARGWLEGDPYKTSSGQPLSRWASQIQGFYR